MLRQFVIAGLFLGMLIGLEANLGLRNPTQAQANTVMLLQTTGGIQGHVIASDGNSLTGVLIAVLDGQPWFFTVATTTLQANGSYAIAGLTPGTYYIEFNPQESYYRGSNSAYLAEYYNDTRDINQVDPVTVTANNVTEEINALLQLGGSITGVVTAKQTGQPLANVPVEIYSHNIPNGINKTTRTDAFGRYAVNGLPGGTYIIRWNYDYSDLKSLYLSEWYNGQPAEEKAELVTVTAGSVTPNINVALTIGGMIRGRVTSAATGAPIAHAEITLCAAVGDHCTLASTQSDPTGAYTVTRLATGAYRLYFVAGLNHYSTYPNYSYPYFSEYYQDKPSLQAADLVQVEVSTVVTVHTALEPSLNITGRVADATTDQGLIFRGTNIAVYTENGDYVKQAYQSDFSDIYAVTELPPGRYRLRATDSDYTPLYYSQTVTFESATTLVVESRQALTHINFSLTPLRHDALKVATAAQLPDALMQMGEQITVPQYSLDGGLSWRLFATTPWQTGGYAAQIALAPRNIITAPVRFIVAASSQAGEPLPVSHGIYRTGDNGRSWAAFVPPIEPPCTEPFVTFSHLANSPADPTRLYVIAACYDYEQTPTPLNPATAAQPTDTTSSPQGYTAYPRLYTSADAGLTWQRATLPGTNSSSFWPTQFVLSPVMANRLYIYTQDNLNAYRWLQSNDAGQTWITANFTPTALALDAANAARLYAVFDAGSRNVFRYTGKRSVDGGAKWMPWQQQPCPTSFRQLLALPVEGLLLLQCDQGIFRSRNYGDAWEQIRTLPDQMLALDYGKPGRILGSRAGVLYASSDQGTTWARLDSANNLWMPMIRVR